MDITRFPYDIQYLIWKLYFSNSVLTSLKTKHFVLIRTFMNIELFKIIKVVNINR